MRCICMFKGMKMMAGIINSVRQAVGFENYTLESAHELHVDGAQEIDRMDLEPAPQLNSSQRGAGFFSQTVFGPEFTFTNPSLIAAHKDHGQRSYDVEYTTTPESHLCLNKFAKLLQTEAKGNFRVNYAPTQEKCRVTYADNWWFEVTTDPEVIEVRSAPMTVGNAKIFQDRIQRHIFDMAARIGLYADETRGNGHINIDFGPFEKNPLLLRNFIVDYINHPGLALGTCGNDPCNAPPLALMFSSRRPSEQYQALVAVLADFDADFAQGKACSFSLATALNAQVFKRTWSHLWQVQAEKFQALSVNHILDEGDPSKRRIEIRAHKPQQNAAEWTALIELYDKRIQYLTKLRGVLPLKPEKELAMHILSNSTHQISLDAATKKRLAGDLADYVHATGLSLSPYKKYLKDT